MKRFRYTRISNETILMLVFAFLLLAAGMATQNFILILSFLPVIFGAAVVSHNDSIFYSAVVVSWFTLEQFYFTVFSGTFRVYFLLSIVVVILFIKYLREFESEILLAYFIMFVGAFFSALISSSMSGALRSTIFLLLNSLPVLVVVALLKSEIFSFRGFQKMIASILGFVLLFGLIQYVVYQFTGIGIGINYSTVASQLSMGQISGFRQEANTHGKLVGWAIVFCLPPIICNSREKKYYRILAAAVLTLLLSMTRSAAYAMLLTVACMVVYYIFSGFQGRVGRIIGIMLAVVIVAYVLLNTGVISGDSYSAYKLQELFTTNIDNVSEDGSAGFRFRSMAEALKIWSANLRTRLFGVGYGQAVASVEGAAGLTRVGGNDMISLLVGNGIMGVILFTVMNVLCFRTAFTTSREASYRDNQEMKIFADQMLFCGIYGFLICFLSGILQVPEYWITVGICAGMGTRIWKREEIIE